MHTHQLVQEHTHMHTYIHTATHVHACMYTHYCTLTLVTSTEELCVNTSDIQESTILTHKATLQTRRINLPL